MEISEESGIIKLSYSSWKQSSLSNENTQDVENGILQPVTKYKEILKTVWTVCVYGAPAAVTGWLG